MKVLKRIITAIMVTTLLSTYADLLGGIESFGEYGDVDPDVDSLLFDSWDYGRFNTDHGMGGEVMVDLSITLTQNGQLIYSGTCSDSLGKETTNFSHSVPVHISSQRIIVENPSVKEVKAGASSCLIGPGGQYSIPYSLTANQSLEIDGKLVKRKRRV